jgi:hypothetical protein
VARALRLIRDREFIREPLVEFERDEGRLWLTTSGDKLFSDSDEEPLIFNVEARRGSYGFDLLAMAPERQRFLDKVEMALPDLKVADHAATGRASQVSIPDSFRRFFRELGERKDREQIKKRDLYLNAQDFASRLDRAINRSDRAKLIEGRAIQDE